MATDPKTYSGASHFASDSNYEVQRGNHYEISIDLAPLGLGNTYEQAIRLCCTSASVPTISIQNQVLRHGNESVNVAGSPSWNSISISVYDVIGRDMAQMLQQWFYKVFNPMTHTMGLVKDYKTTANLLLYSPDASSVRKWVCYGVYPTSLNFGTYSADSQGSAMTVSMELAVDRSLLVSAGMALVGYGNASV